jgi:hypothetical protein
MIRKLISSVMRSDLSPLKGLNHNSLLVANVLQKDKPGWVRRRLKAVDHAAVMPGDCEVVLPSPTKSYFGFSAYEQLSLMTWSSPDRVEAVTSGKVDELTIEEKRFYEDRVIESNAFQVSVQYLLHRVSFVLPADAPSSDVEAVAADAVKLMKAIHNNEIMCEYHVDLQRLESGHSRPIVGARFVDATTELPHDLPPHTRMVRRCWNGRGDVLVERTN